MVDASEGRISTDDLERADVDSDALNAHKCTCRNCQSAVSPAAYLAYLLRYATGHLKTEGDGTTTDRSVSLQAIAETYLCRPVDELPIGCEGTDPVRHVRLEIETLLGFMESKGLTEYTKRRGQFYPAFFDDDERMETYRQRAYRTLLEEWGTSRAELREASYDEETREWVADSVGIPERTVSNLALDADATLGASSAVSETNLEEMFGLPRATRLETLKRKSGQPGRTAEIGNPMPDPPDEPSIKQWRLASLSEQWRTEDYPNDPYSFHEHRDAARLPFVDPDLVGPDDIRPTMAALTGSSTGQSSSQSSSGGSVPAAFKTLATTASASKSKSKSPAATAPPGIPGDDRVAKLWRKRRRWVDSRLRSVWSARPSLDSNERPVVSILNDMTGSVSYETDSLADSHAPAWYPDGSATALAAGSSGSTKASASGLDLGLGSLALSTVGFFEDMLLLREQLTAADERARAARQQRHDDGFASGSIDEDVPPEVSAAETVEERFTLAVDAFVELVGLLERHYSTDAESLSEAEWWTIASILTRAKKSSLRRVWIDEESNRGVHLDRRWFWQSRREPKTGEWSFRRAAHGDTTSGTAASDAEPYVDPERLSSSDLREDPFPKARYATDARPADLASEPTGHAARVLYHARSKALAEKRETFTEQFERRRESMQTTFEGYVTTVRKERATIEGDIANYRANNSGPVPDRLTDRSAIDPVLDDVYTDRNWESYLSGIRNGLGKQSGSSSSGGSGSSSTKGGSSSGAKKKLETLSLSESEFQQLWRLRERGKPTTQREVSADDVERLVQVLPLGSPLDPVLTRVYRSEHDDGLSQFYDSKTDADWDGVFDAIETDTQSATTSGGKSSGGGSGLLDTLDLSQNEYESIARVRSAAMPSADSAPPADQRVSEAIATLTSVWKRLERYDPDASDNWIDEESVAGLTEYWHVYKARLPSWRASKQRRSNWSERLQIESGPPILDPDLLRGPDDFAEPAWETAGFDVYQSRDDTLSSVDSVMTKAVSAVSNASTATAMTDRLDALVRRVLGIDLDGLRSLGELARRGTDIGVLLQRLDLSPDAFGFLMDIDERLGQRPLTDEEWANVGSILTAVWKRRQFARWHREEWRDNVGLVPEQFDLPDGDESFEPPADDDPQRWRVDTARRSEWEDRLESRIEQREAVDETLQSAIEAAEIAALPVLRELLIEEIPDALGVTTPRVSFDEKAEWLTERLFIDVESNPERETTRVSQAITSLQLLIRRTRTGATDDVGDLPATVEDDSFWDRWDWLGSYPSWRSAMGVYLYPGNVLMPSLRQWQTPGFHDIVSGEMERREFTQDDAAEVYRSYLDQLQDIDDLTNLCGCTGTGWTSPKSPQGEGSNTVCYVFGTPTGETTTVYFRTFDPARTNRSHSVLWPASGQGKIEGWKRFDLADKLKGGTIARIHDVVYYDDTLYLFLDRSDETGAKHLGYLTFDLSERSWSKFDDEGFPTNVYDGGQGTETIHDLAVATEGHHDPPRILMRTTYSTTQPGKLIPKEKSMAPKLWERLNDLLEKGTSGSPDNARQLSRREQAFWADGTDLTYVLAFGEDGSPPEEPKPVAYDRIFHLNGVTGDGEAKTSVGRNFWLKDDTGTPVFDPISHDSATLVGFYGVSDGEYLAVYHSDSRDRLVSVLYGLPDSSDGRVTPGNRYASYIHQVSNAGKVVPDTVFFSLAQHTLFYVFAGDGTPLVKSYDYIADTRSTVSMSLPPSPGALRFIGDPSLLGVSKSIGAVFISKASVSDDRGGKVKASRYRSSPGTVTEFVTLTPRYPFAQLSTIDRFLRRETIRNRASVDSEALQNEYSTAVETLLDHHVFERGEMDTTGLEYEWGSRDHTSIYIEEAFFHLPLYLARRLTRSGNYDAALWWFRYLFDYVTERPVWPGDLTGGPTTDLTPGEEWLADPIHPHAIAKTRDGAYLKFVLLSIIQCLEDFGDEEFGKDTARSVATATWLYETALDLLDHPLLIQEDDPCKLVVDRLDRFYEREVMQAKRWTDTDYSRAELRARGEELVRSVREIRDFTDRKQAVRTIMTHINNDDFVKAFETGNVADETRRYKDQLRDGTRWVGWTGNRYSSIVGGNARRLVNIGQQVNDFYATPMSVQSTVTGGTQSSDGDGSTASGRSSTSSGDGTSQSATGTATNSPSLGSGGHVGSFDTQPDWTTTLDQGSVRNDAAVDTTWSWQDDPTVDVSNDNIDAAGATTDEQSQSGTGSTQSAGSQRSETASTSGRSETGSDGAGTGHDWRNSLNVSGLNTDDPVAGLDSTVVPDQGGDSNVRVPDDENLVDPGFPGGAGSGRLGDYSDFDTSKSVMDIFLSNYTFCIPDNPFLSSLRRHAELNLRKIRAGRNIAGMERELAAHSASVSVEEVTPTPTEGLQVDTGGTQSPTNYRFETLLERAKELARLAQQTESQLLSALTNMARETQKQKQADQSVELARERVSLQEARVQRARDKVALSRMQRERANIKRQRYNQWISTGKLADQRMAETYLSMAMAFHYGAGMIHFGLSSFYFATGFGATKGFQSLASSFSSFASMSSTYSQLLQMRAAHQRRMRRWKLQRDLAAQNAKIGSQRVTIARDEVAIARQQREIAELRSEHAEDMLEFHRQKFTDRELFRWMSKVLERVYRYYLGQATSVARLAQRQLAFQRQGLPQQFIEGDYWSAPGEAATASTDEDETDRKGLTGSARLQRDITKLEQYEFETDERKLQVEKTVSLADSEPLALQRFRETGEVTFSTTLEEFDLDHPGLFMRQIKDVRVTIAALTSPEGINAKLRSNGISRIVVDDGLFTERTIQRDPETVVLDRAEEGLREEDRFTLRPQKRRRLRPFENSGVATEWELQMPKAANDFDYDTIADVRLTIEYTAHESQTYRQQVIDRLPAERTVERSFSLHDDFSDAWYELTNAEGHSRTVSFETEREDFPSNLNGLEIDGVQVYFAGPTDPNDREDLSELDVTLTHTDSNAARGSPVEALFDTRGTFGGDGPEQEWSLTVDLPEYGPMSEPFESDHIDDVLVVVTLQGRPPEWPR